MCNDEGNVFVTDVSECNIDELVPVKRDTDAVVPVFIVELPSVWLVSVCNDEGSALVTDVSVCNIDELVPVKRETNAVVAVFTGVLPTVWLVSVVQRRR